MIGYCRIGSFVVAGSLFQHFLLATASHPTVIDPYWDLFTQSSTMMIVEKLVFVKSNLPTFHVQQLLVDDDYESKANDSDHFTDNE